MPRQRTNPSAPPVEHVHDGEPQTQIIPEMGVRSLAPSQDTPLMACPTNLNLNTARGKALAIAAGSPADIVPDQMGEAHITAVNWLIFPDRRADPETGKIGQFSRLVFFDAEGRTLHSTASHAPQVMRRMLDLYDDDDWKRGINIVVRARRNRANTATYHDFRVIPWED